MAEAIVYALIAWSVRSAVVIAGAATLLWALRLKDASFRLTAWTVVLTGVLLMPTLGYFAPALSLPIPDSWLEVGSAAPSALPASPPAPEPVPGLYRQTSGFSLPDLPQVAVAVWLAVALCMLARILLGWILSVRLVRKSSPIDSGTRESHLIHVPMTVGLFRAVVLLPAGWREWSEGTLNAVLAHERGHAARRDPLRQFAASIYRSLAWFNPLSWWLRARLVELGEAASDDAALAAHGDRITYAETLLGFIERSPRRVEWAGVAMANRRSRMRRMERVLDSNRKLSSAPGVRAVAALVLAAGPVIYLAAAVRPVRAEAPMAAPAPVAPMISQEPTSTAASAHTAASAQAAGSTQAASEFCGGVSAYRKWLAEDVVSIITAKEREAMTQLRTEKACADFVEEFWRRRDPDRSSPVNRFKQEHYRRIAYANKRFASGLPGWRTDRGRTYIRYGPPDEIEAHPSGRGRGDLVPSENWLYRHIEGEGDNAQFDFVDPSRNGEYRLERFSILTPSPK